MPHVFLQLKEYVRLVGADKLISAPTPEEKVAFEGSLFIRGLANVSLIKALAN